MRRATSRCGFSLSFKVATCKVIKTDYWHIKHDLFRVSELSNGPFATLWKPNCYFPCCVSVMHSLICMLRLVKKRVNLNVFRQNRRSLTVTVCILSCYFSTIPMKTQAVVAICETTKQQFIFLFTMLFQFSIPFLKSVFGQKWRKIPFLFSKWFTLLLFLILTVWTKWQKHKTAVCCYSTWIQN